MKFKFPKNIFSNTIFKNVLYLVSLALGVSYIINEQSLALISLIMIACGVYLLNKSVVIALFVSIIITNLLLSMNYLKDFDVIEGMTEEGEDEGVGEGNQSLSTSETKKKNKVTKTENQKANNATIEDFVEGTHNGYRR